MASFSLPDLDTIRIARDVFWSLSFSSLALFVKFKSRDEAYSRYSHVSLLLWSFAAAIRLLLHIFLHIDADLPKVIKLFQDPSFSFSVFFWSGSIYTKHAFLWNTLLNMPPLIFICSCVPTLLGWSSEGIGLRLRRRSNDFSSKKIVAFAVLFTFAAMAASQWYAGHNVFQLMRAKGTFFFTAINVFTHALDVISLVPQVFAEELRDHPNASHCIAVLDWHFLFRVLVRLSDFALFYVPNAHVMTPQMFFRVKNLQHVMTVLLILQSTTTVLRMMLRRVKGIALLPICFVVVCVALEVVARGSSMNKHDFSMANVQQCEGW